MKDQEVRWSYGTQYHSIVAPGERMARYMDEARGEQKV